MNLKQLHYFLVVAQEHQITSAAKLLYTTQPPLSYQLKQLEKELGVKLFLRSAHGIELTEEGKIFQQYAQKMVNLTDNVQEELQRGQAGTLGNINLGLISSAGELLFNQAIKNFTRYYPAVTFQITEGNTYELTRMLNNGLLDLAIVRTPFNMQGLMKKKLITEGMVAVFDSQHFDLPAGPLTLADLGQQPLILYRRFAALFNDTFAHHGLVPFYAVKCDDARTAILWADQGMGVALVPASIAARYANKKVVAVDCDEWQTTVQAVWRKDIKLRAVGQRFIAALPH